MELILQGKRVEMGTGAEGGGVEQQDSEIYRWIFESPWPSLSVILFCVLQNRREKTDSTGDGADSVIYRRLITQDIWLLCIRNIDQEEETVQTFKDFPLLDITKKKNKTYSCFLVPDSSQIQLLFWLNVILCCSLNDI